MNVLTINSYSWYLLYRQNQRNRIDKPTEIYGHGSFVFCVKGHTGNKYHRKNLPASVGNTASFWYKNGKCHNINGPARISFKNLKPDYYIDGEFFTKDDWEIERLKYLYPRLHIKENDV